MTNPYFWERIVGRDPNLRASDADRERIAERLRKAHAEGRIDTDEFQDRLECCYEAKTFGQLDALVRDLPRQDELEKRRSLYPSLPWRLGTLVPVLLALLVVSAVVGHPVFLVWFLFIFLFWRMSRRRRWPADRQRFPNHQL